MPYLLLVPFLFNIIFYFLADLAPSLNQFIMFYLISFLVGLCGNSLGLLLGSSISNPKGVSAAMPMVIMPFILVSGYFKNAGNLPVVLNWIQHISPLKYGFAAMLTNEVSGRSSPLDELNFDILLNSSIVLLCCLAVGYRLLSLFFLWSLKSKVQ